jgi:hypothetical protein
MLRLFSPRVKFGLWRKLWLELARCQRELGLSDRISEPAIAQMQATLDDIDFAGAADWEKRLRHDVMAHVHTFEEAAPAAKGIVHLGATSQYVVDNADLILMRDAMKLIAGRLASAIDALGTFAVQMEGPANARLHAFPTRAAHDRRQARDAVGSGPGTGPGTARVSDFIAALPRREGDDGHAGVVPGIVRWRSPTRSSSSIAW